MVVWQREPRGPVREADSCTELSSDESHHQPERMLHWVPGRPGNATGQWNGSLAQPEHRLPRPNALEK